MSRAAPLTPERHVSEQDTDMSLRPRLSHVVPVCQASGLRVNQEAAWELLVFPPKMWFVLIDLEMMLEHERERDRERLTQRQRQKRDGERWRRKINVLLIVPGKGVDC